MIIKKPIMITGSHRSGTTWVANILANVPRARFIDEPFWGLGYHKINFFSPCYWFQYISQKNERNFLRKVKWSFGGLNFFLLKTEEMLLKYKRTNSMSPLIFKKYIWNVSQSLFFNNRLVIKSPVGIFSSEWLVKKFNMEILIMIRHPAAFVGSLKSLNWQFNNFGDFISQPLLMERFLYPFEEEIIDYSENEHDIIDQGILLWKLIYYTVVKYKYEHKNWIFIRHEDISREPLRWFRFIFDRLNLEFSNKIKNIIKEYSGLGKNRTPQNINRNRFTIRRNSLRNIYTWKKRLTKSEIIRIKEGVKGVSEYFYSANDW